MKKIFCSILVVTLLLIPFTFGVGAAGALNEYEQNIINQLSKTITNGSTSYSIPAEYVNQAKTYFLTADVTEAQSKEILANINEGSSTIQSQMVSGQTFNLSSLPTNVKTEILSLGQDASKTVGLSLVYTADKQVKITNTATGSVAFNNSPIIKTTGAAANVVPAFATVSVVALLLGAALVFAKKTALFVK